MLCAPVPNGAVPVGPGPRDRLDELEKGNGAELEPVAGVETPVPVPIQEVPVGPRAAVEDLLNGNGAVPVALGNIPVEFPAEYGGDEVWAVQLELAGLDIPVPVERKPVEENKVELNSGNGTVDTTDAEAVTVVDAAPVVKGVPLADDSEKDDPRLSERPVELRVRVMIRVMVLIVALPLTIKLVLAEAVMASTLEVPKMGWVVRMLGVADAVSWIEVECSDVGAELGPTPVDV